jgi:hypothetical protein
MELDFMGKLTAIGRFFYGIAVAVLGFLTISYRDFPYMLIPPNHSLIPGIEIIAYIFGAMFILAGTCIVFEKKVFPAALLLGTVLLLIFCFYFIPYQFLTSSNYIHLEAWENAAKELTLAGGAFVIASNFPKKNGNKIIMPLNKIIPCGVIFFAITIISYGINHFLNLKGVAAYTPAWVPYRLFWAYVTGTALLASGIAIILKIKVRLIASLLGTMIFIWFAILHIPRIIASPSAYLGSEVASACLALAYSGIAFVIAGAAK